MTFLRASLRVVYWPCVALSCSASCKVRLCSNDLLLLEEEEEESYSLLASRFTLHNSSLIYSEGTYVRIIRAHVCILPLLVFFPSGRKTYEKNLAYSSRVPHLQGRCIRKRLPKLMSAFFSRRFLRHWQEDV